MKRFSLLLIIVGMIIFLIPIGGRLYMHYQQERMYQQYLQDLKDQNSALSQTFQTDISSNSAISSTASALTKEKKPVRKVEDVIGRISIPAISSDQLLLEGSDSKHLKYGAGHVTGTPLPGEKGNCSIAGHRNYTFGSYFNRLGEVNPGDTISIQYNNGTYTYKVTDILIVKPDDVSVLVNTPDSATITLITCHPKGSNTHRLIVKGVLQ
ncbi:class D sortase [Aminipila terrae]|uniref:Sortase n=1 Tax=Aminipila terrae TaxID=2697030 RepID=A0A6P1MLH5_9FIRM|nr:class D sortase [Aminipila terrae]QHI71835.1 sortase [Aminipila terrae]